MQTVCRFANEEALMAGDDFNILLFISLAANDQRLPEDIHI